MNTKINMYTSKKEMSNGNSTPLFEVAVDGTTRLTLEENGDLILN